MSKTNQCPRCGAPIRPDESPAGACAACLMKMGLDSRSGTAEVVFTENEKSQRTPAPTIAELAPHFPELEILELVGRGGMGAVYRAKHRSLARDVALKILTVGTDDATFADRFQREARTLASLSHPGITAVFDFGQRGPWSFLAMEFVEGASLRQMLRARELGSRESLAVVSQMCDALQYAHDKGVVHRDIKPENVLVTRDGCVKVLDFGLAKLVGTAQRENLTQAKQVMGTPHYMAPEQWEKPLTVDHRADIYAMGVVFYELLTGELPIGRFAPPSHKVAVDVRLDDVVLRSLEKEPDRRYQHASQVKDEVAGITSTPGGASVVATDSERRRSSSRKWLVASAAVGCLLLLIVPAALTFFLFAGPSRSASASRLAAASTATAALASASGATASIDDSDSASHSPLTIDAATAAKLGIAAELLPDLDRDLALAWKSYLDWESKELRLVWLTPETVGASGSNDGSFEQAERAIGRATERSDRPDSAYQQLVRLVRRHMRFQDTSVRFEFSIRDAVATVRRIQARGDGSPDIVEDTIESPPSAALQRVWNRAVAERDHVDSK